LPARPSSTARIDPAAPEEFGKDKKVVAQQAAVFVAGKIADRVGAFAEWAYDALEHRGSLDALDIRYADRIGEGNQGLVYGLTLHNRPGLQDIYMQDIYNTGLTWGFPFASSAVAVAPNAELAVDGLGQQVAGLGAYGMWRNTRYAEFVA